MKNIFKYQKKKDPRMCLLVLGLAVFNLGFLIYLVLSKCKKGKCPRPVELKVKIRKPMEEIEEIEETEEIEEIEEVYEPQVQIIGSTGSDKYHKPTCSYAKNITEDNVVYFDSEEDAKERGYKPCGVCH